MTTTKRMNAVGVKPVEITDPGDAGAIVPTDSWNFCNLVSAGAETRTLGRPLFEGQRLQLNMKTDGGDITLTVATTFNQAGNNTGVFADAGDIFELVGGRNGSDLEWKVATNDGVAVSTV